MSKVMLLVAGIGLGIAGGASLVHSLPVGVGLLIAAWAILTASQSKAKQMGVGE